MPKYINWLFGTDGALFRAAAIGRLDLTGELIAGGANVNIASRNGYTPLHRAAQNGHEGVVNLLLEHGANPGAMSNDKVSPIDLARNNGHKAIVERLGGKA